MDPKTPLYLLCIPLSFRQEAVGHFHHEEPVYCISLPSDDENLFATAGEGGTVLIWDIRIPEGIIKKFCLSNHSQ